MAIVTAHVEAVQQLYVAYFNRPADYAGLDYWTNVVAANAGDTTAVSAAFAAEAEYQTEYEDLTNEQIVDKVYQNLFGRAAEAAGKTYWADLLTAGSITIDKVVADIAAGAQTTDAEAYENKVAGATLFTDALDTAAEQSGYSGAEANTAAKAFVSSITTDASLATATAPAALNATVAAVVAAGTPFTLAGAMANVLAAQEAKSDFLADLVESNDDIDALLGSDPTDAQIEAAVGTLVSNAEAAIDVILPGFSTASDVMQGALIADEQADLAAQLATRETALATAQANVAKVDGLAEAIAASEAAADILEAAALDADLALNAQTAAQANVATRTGQAVTVNGDGDYLVGATVAIELADGEYSLASGVNDEDFEGITAFMEALNATVAANAAETEATTAAAQASLAADILDTADNNTLLKAVAAEMVFVAVDDDELPTYQQILTEQELFNARLEDLGAVAVAAGYADYQAALADIDADVSAAADATAADAVLDAAVTAGYITSADATVIQAAYVADPATVTVALVEENSWFGRDADMDAAVTALVAAETAEAGVGALAAAQTTAETNVDATETAIKNLNDAVADYNAAKEVEASLDATDDAIDATIDIITDEGFAAPVTLVNGGISLSTSNDDIFVAGSSEFDAQIRSFGVFGQDTLYVGTALTYNSTVIGSGTGETALDEAGNNSALEFFLNETSTGVEVILENKAFGSESAADADLTIITLVGVELDDITVANGFITVGTSD